MIRTTFLFLMMALFGSVALAADWSFPLTIQSGAARTNLTLSVQAGATNGFDAGKDVPGRPYEDDLLYASFPHSGWGINLGGELVSGFSRDTRGTLPQDYMFEVISKQTQVTLSWSTASLPVKTSMTLNHSAAGVTIDMSSRSSYSFNPGGTAPVALSIQVSQGDVSPPSAPGGINLDERESSLYLSWDKNSESDLAGYKVHFGTDSGRYSRSIDVHNVTNYSLFNLKQDETYYVSVTAYDEEGNESSPSSEVSGGYQFDDGAPLSPTGLSASATETTLRVIWDRNSEEDLAGYNVYLGSKYGDYSSSTNVGLTTSYQLPNPVSGKTYYVAVSAYDHLGNEGDLSSSISASLTEVIIAPGVPDEGDVLPSESTTTSTDEAGSPTTTLVGGIRVSPIYLNVPGQSEKSTRERTTERVTRTEKSKKKTEEGSAPVADGTSPQQDHEVVELEETTAVSGKPGVHRIELDEQPWKLMTIPLKVSVNKPFSEFVARSAEINRLIGWDSSLQSYRRMKYPRPGAAFWLKAGKGYALLEGQAYREDVVSLPLVKGWNLLGSPYLESVSFQNARIKLGEKLLTLPTAVKSKYLANDLQSYVSGRFVHDVMNGEGKFKPWRGYWVFANQDCQLILYSKAAPKVLQEKSAHAIKSSIKGRDSVQSDVGLKGSESKSVNRTLAE